VLSGHNTKSVSSLTGKYLLSFGGSRTTWDWRRWEYTRTAYPVSAVRSTLDRRTVRLIPGWRNTTYIHRWTHRKHRFCCQVCVVIGPVPSNEKYLLRRWFFCRVRVFRALPRNGSTFHSTPHTTAMRTSIPAKVMIINWLKFPLLIYSVVSRDSAVGIATGYGLDDWEVGVRVPVGSRIITSPCRPDMLWGPPNLLYNGYRELFPGGKAAGAWSWPLTSN
jgi:hypothetical protein